MIKLKEILQTYQNDLETICSSGEDILKQSNLAIVLSNNCLNSFRKTLEITKFKTPEEEIFFFKNIKSKPLAQLIYFKEVRSFEMSIPKTTQDIKKRYISKQLNLIDKFFKQHFEFLQYIDQNFTHLDRLYFLRNKEDLYLLIHNGACYYDTVFNTSHDELYARIEAYKYFMKYLRNRYDAIDNPYLKRKQLINQKSKLVWTAPKSALIELVYALHCTNVFNNEQTEIKQIADMFQNIFNCDLGDYYKVFSEIKTRQKTKTKFLEELAYNLQEFITKSYQ
ncbi:RteC domain-containing protein [Xanthomarina spongicola]|uniref:RteC protein n=1 Tax=Xanthomarina spongicola TaxID=570520 RepID=A0A316DKA9_9FLAO|nr:RteC domain-containing protein [Xanthomarina spongicola]PWK17113.1 RteC protein [Xanthomarina spongicola]